MALTSMREQTEYLTQLNIFPNLNFMLWLQNQLDYATDG